MTNQMMTWAGERGMPRASLTSSGRPPESLLKAGGGVDERDAVARLEAEFADQRCA
jgi:hypothetical protein